MNPRDVIEKYIFSLLGKEYIYGGAGPNFDCSGFVLDILKASGIAIPHDMTAGQIFEFVKPDAQWDVRKFGSLIFFGQSLGAITHIGFMLNALQMAEAGGGDSKTLTKEDAQKRGAFTRIRPITARKDVAVILAPKYPWF